MSNENTTSTTAIARKQETPASRLNQYLQARSKNLAQYARNSVNPATMIRLAVFQFSQDDWLQKCQPETVYSSLITAAQLGLEPSGVRGEAYLVPFKGKCTLIPGWRGLIKLALRSKAVKQIYSHVVLDGDEFAVMLGTAPKIHHVPAINAGPERDVIAAYAVAVMENGAVDIEVMDADELNRIRTFAAAGRGGKDGPAYTQWADQMARKAPIRRLCKRLPLGDDYFLAAKLDELHDEGKPEQIGKFIDVQPNDAAEIDQATGEVSDAKPDRIAAAVEKVR